MPTSKVSNSAKQGRDGFTLIELLVVISIIALLIGILLPALGAARGVARTAQSGSNQRQIGIAMAAYQADNNEYFPLWQQDDIGQMVSGQIIWYWTTKIAVDDYIPGLDVYIDPAFDGANTDFVPGSTPDTPEALDRDSMDSRVFNWIHYGYNYVWVGSGIWGNARRSEWAVTDPRYITPSRVVDMEDATTVMVTCSSRDWSPAGKATNPGPTPPIDPDGIYGAHVVLDTAVAVSNAGYPHARHSDSVQNAWADGHVSLVSVPFTQEEQDQGGGLSLKSATEGIFSTEAMGDADGVQFARGTSPAAFAGKLGNYFDLDASTPSRD
ncbi:MAG: type II secretion system protein [Planctomycetota bacterium]